jgi:hypothetical protein
MQMYTAEQIAMATSRDRLLAKQGRKGSQIMTSKEAQEHAISTGSITTISSRKHNVFFFTDNDIFGYTVIPSDFVSSTTSIPLRVVGMPGVEDGYIRTVEQYIAVFESDKTQLTTIDALVDLLNSET